MTDTTIQRATYALAVADKLARDGERGNWLSVKQAAWLRAALSDAVTAGANGDRGGQTHTWALRCSWNTHNLVTLSIAPNHAGVVKRFPNCECGN